MSIVFMVCDQKIFKATNGLLNDLYLALDEIIVTENIVLNSEIKQFLDCIKDLKGVFPYFDIAEFITTSSGMDIFLLIFFQALNKLGDYNDATFLNLCLYYRVMLKYRNWLAEQGK